MRSVSMSREKYLKSLFDTDGVGLEIGPSHNPLLPKKQGYNVEILDHLCQKSLINKYQNATGVNLSNIEIVDYVLEEKSLYETIQKDGYYDFIVASHVIEHTYDMIGFLNDCSKLMKNSGKLVLAVPDKRFSFDVLRSLSSTGDFIQASIEKRQCHSIGNIFDELMYNSLRDEAIGWLPSDQGELTFFNSMDKAKNIFDNLIENNKSIDIHAWQFTPSSFRLIINDLHQNNFIQLSEQKFHDVQGEFYMVLEKKDSKLTIPRITLAKKIIEEQYEIHVNTEESSL